MKNSQTECNLSKIAPFFSALLMFLMFFSLSVDNASAGMPNLNDQCVDSIDIFDGTTPFDSTGAATSMPPFTCSSGVGSDLWYTYTPTCTGVAIIDTEGSNYDTVIEAISGTDCNSLGNVLGCDDDGGPGLDSRLNLEVSENDSFFLRVGGFEGASGSGQVNIECDLPPDNNMCDGSFEAFSGVNPFDNMFALPLTPPSDPAFPQGCIFAEEGASQDVWYDYRATCTGNVSFSTCSPNTTIDSVIELFSTNDCGSLAGNSAACNDDNIACPYSGTLSSLTYPVKEGEKYRVRIASFNESTGGTGDLVVTPEAGCTESACYFKRNAHNKLNIRNATPNKNVILLWGFKRGNSSLKNSACAGLPIGIAKAKKIAKFRMNSSGNKQTRVKIPSTPESRGFIQMVDLDTCTAGEVRDARFTAGAIPPGKGCVYTFSNEEIMMMSVAPGEYTPPKEFAEPKPKK